MAKTWEKWFDEVLPDVPGCGQDVAKNAIRNAAIDFCDRSWVWRVDHADIDSLDGIASYAYAPPANTKVVVPTAVWYSKVALEPKATHELGRLYRHWPSMSGTGPFYYVQEQLESLVIVPFPVTGAVGAIKLKVALKPTRASASIDDQIWEKYLEEIARGAKAKLFRMKKKPWSDATQAAALQLAFDQDIAKAKLAADRGFTRTTQRVRAHFF